MNLFGDHPTLSHAWGVLSLFLIPIGGGIPSGVLLARDYGFTWQVTSVLYLISDVILAFIFEPVLILLMSAGKKSGRAGAIGNAFKQTVHKTLANYGNKAGPLALILIAFGADPMTGRSAAQAVGHGFLFGWVLAITGDMIFFALMMSSTLWLDGILGDGTLTTIIVLGGMMIIPWLVRKVRGERNSPTFEDHS